MVNTLHIRVTYKSKKHIVECQQHEFAKKIAETFNVNVNNVILFAVNKENERRPITLEEIADLMKIEMIPKKNNRNAITSYLENDSSPSKSFANIITKLKTNSTLTGLERKSLVELLESPSNSVSKKRKLGDNTSSVATVNKKVQVNFFSSNFKDSFAQTDPVNIESSEPTDEEAIIFRMKRLASHGSAIDKQEAANLMNISYHERRNFILRCIPPVSLVHEQYPLLFNVDEVKNELDRIFYPGKCREFLANMEKYSFILDTCDKTSEVFVRTQKSIESGHTQAQRKYAKIVGSIFAFSQLLEEEFSYIHLRDIPHGSNDLFPFIDASVHSLKEVFRDGVLFRIVVEGQQLCEASNFQEAVLCLIACFFIFNISYTTSCFRTLTVFEKLYLCANDTTEIDERTHELIKRIQLQVNQFQQS